MTTFARLSFATVLAVLVGSGPRASWALDTTPMQAVGRANISGGNLAAARDRALEDALRQAVEQALPYVLDADSRARAAEALRRDLLARPRIYVPTFRVLDAHEVEGNAFQVQVEAQVALPALRRDAVAIAGAGGRVGTGAGTAAGTREGTATATPTRTATATGKPRVLVAAAAPADRPVREALEAQGFATVSVPMGTPPKSDVDAAARAKSAGAGLVAVTSSSSEGEGRVRGTELEAAHARAEVRVLDAEGHAVGHGNAEARAFELDGASAGEQALGEATGKAARQAVEELAAHFSSNPGLSVPAAPVSGVQVQVVGLSSVHDMEDLERTLAAMPGAGSIEPRRLGAGGATLLVHTRDNANQLAAAMRAQGVQVDGVADREIRARFQRATP